jgi:hypothetical protein
MSGTGIYHYVKCRHGMTENGRAKSEDSPLVLKGLSTHLEEK